MLFADPFVRRQVLTIDGGCSSLEKFVASYTGDRCNRRRNSWDCTGIASFDCIVSLRNRTTRRQSITIASWCTTQFGKSPRDQEVKTLDLYLHGYSSLLLLSFDHISDKSMGL